MSDQPVFTMYTTSWCGDCVRIKHWLEENDYHAGVDFQEIDIEQDATAAETVVEINHGHQSVPTLVFLDGSTLTEPSNADLAAKLGQMQAK